MKILHIPCYSTSDPIPVLSLNIEKLKKYTRIGLVATAQHLNRLDEVGGFLKDRGKEVKIGGQIIGCLRDRALSIKDIVDCFVYIGSGRFHPKSLAVVSGKPVFILNPISQVLDQIKDKDIQALMKDQKKRLGRASDAHVFGIIVSVKDGQYDLRSAFELKKSLMSKGFKAFILAGEELSPSNLLPFKIDCIINTACPRIVEDEFDKPILNPRELELIFS